jgi:tripartite-type tricarboxylate transporter receptor subunit TctC
MTGLPPVLPHVRAGKLHALGVASRRRLAQIPEVPTIAESGVPGFEATQWYGLVAPAHTPPAIVEQIATAVQRALARPDVSQHLVTEGAQPGNLGPAEFGAFIRSEIARWGKVVRDAHMQVN